MGKRLLLPGCVVVFLLGIPRVATADQGNGFTVFGLLAEGSALRLQRCKPGSDEHTIQEACWTSSPKRDSKGRVSGDVLLPAKSVPRWASPNHVVLQLSNKAALLSVDLRVLAGCTGKQFDSAQGEVSRKFGAPLLFTKTPDGSLSQWNGDTGYVSLLQRDDTCHIEYRTAALQLEIAQAQADHRRKQDARPSGI